MHFLKAMDNIFEELTFESKKEDPSYALVLLRAISIVWS
jgi:hypothetical protein